MVVPIATPGLWTATGQPPADDPGHGIPAELLEQIVADAQARAEALEQPAERRALPDRSVPAAAHGAVMSSPPRLGVVHSMETPLRRGYAYSIALNVFGKATAQTSAQVCIDPGETIRCVPDNVVAWAVGARANGFTINVEQSGATAALAALKIKAFTRADWLTADGLEQMRRVAQFMVECRDRWGIPLRWATDAEIRAAAAGGRPVGWCLHLDIARVLGGTTHQDAGANYPRDRLMATAIALGSPTPTPTPTRRRPTGALIALQEDDHMATVYQAPGKANPVLVGHGAAPVELLTENERTNALCRHNTGYTGPDGKLVTQPALDNAGKVVGTRPAPVWVEARTLADIIATARTGLGLS